MSKYSKGPWGESANGDVVSLTHPVCEIVRGEWGDSYATLKPIGPSIEGKFQAVIEKIPYGFISKEESEANTKLIVSSPKLLETLKVLLDLYKEVVGVEGRITKQVEEVIREAGGYDE